jgi:hypothetical protein
MIDLLIQYQGKTYGIEIKSFTHQAGYRQALPRTARYGHQPGLEEIYLVSFLDSIDEKTRKIYETDFHDPQTGVTVKPIFIQTGDV